MTLGTLNRNDHRLVDARELVCETEHIIESCRATWARFQKVRVSTQRVLDSLNRRGRDPRASASGADAKPSG